MAVGRWGGVLVARREIERDALASVLAGRCGGGDVLETAVAHLAPAAAAADEVEEGLDLEQGEDLAVAEVLPDRVPAQAGEVRPGGIATEGDLLQEHRRDGKEDAVEDGGEEEQEEELPVQDAEEVGGDDGQVAEDLHERAQHLEEEEVREREGSDDA